MKDFIAQNGGLILTVSMVALALNIVMSGLSKALEVFMDKTSTDLDNRAYAVINKISAVLQKIVDWSSGNRPH